MDQLTTPTGWLESLLGGQVPAYVKAVPTPFRERLRAYLLDLQTERKRARGTIYGHGLNLVPFFVWLADHAPQATLDTISPDHIAHYLEQFRTDGRVQGRNSRREGHQKTARTMYSKAVVLRAFFAWAKQNRHCQANPVDPFHFEWGPRTVAPLSEEQVTALLSAWTDPATHPRTAAVGLLCLVYGLSTSRIASLPLSAVDLTAGIFHGLAVPVPIPDWLRPVLERYLRWRRDLLKGTSSDKFVVTHPSRNIPACACFFHQMLRRYGVNVRQLRDTALVQTIQRGHLRLITVFGLSHHSLSRYEAVARLVQNTRTVDPKPNLW